MVQTKASEWKETAKAAYERYLEAVERDLPPGSSVADIEKVMLKHYAEMMSATMQALADAQELPPPGDTRGP